MVKVVGVGNPLLGDDGFGLKVVDFLKTKNIENVEFIQLPTPSPWELYETFIEGSYFIIIDALANGTDSEIEVFPISELKSNPSYLRSQHEVSIAQVIDLLSLTDIKIDGVIVGAKCRNITPSLKLSNDLEKLVPIAAEVVEKLIKERLKC